LESGFYANLTIELPGEAVAKLRGKLALCNPVYRHLLVAVSKEEAGRPQKAATEAIA